MGAGDQLGAALFGPRVYSYVSVSGSLRSHASPCVVGIHLWDNEDSPLWTFFILKPEGSVMNTAQTPTL